MNHSGDAAEQVVRISLEGMEYALRIAGAGAKHIAAFLVAAVKSDGTDNKTKLRGKERLTNMLKSGKELKIFAIKNSDLERFSKEAKRYGVVYCALKDKGDSVDSLVDIMAKAEDASKVSRIMDRLQFTVVEKASVEAQADGQEQDAPDRNDTDELLDMLIDADGKAIPSSPPVAEIVGGDTPHPTQARSDENRPSASRSVTQPVSVEDTRGTKKPESVKAFLRERTTANRQKREDKQPYRPTPGEKPKQPQKPAQHTQPSTRRKKQKKVKERS